MYVWVWCLMYDAWCPYFCDTVTLNYYMYLKFALVSSALFMHIAHIHSALYYANFGCIALPWVASLDGPSCPSGSPSLNVLPIIVIAVYLFVKNKLSLSLTDFSIHPDMKLTMTLKEMLSAIKEDLTCIFAQALLSTSPRKAVTMFQARDRLWHKDQGAEL